MARFELNPQEMLQFVRSTLAVNKRLPKKYRDQMSHLLNAYREVMYTQRITIPAGELGLRWRCAVADLPKILYLMTRGSKNTVTFTIGPGTPGVGTTVQLRFAVQEGGTYDASSPSK